MKRVRIVRFGRKLGGMATPTYRSARGDQAARTYLPERDRHQELLEFQRLVRQLGTDAAQNEGRAALVDPAGLPRPIPDEIFRILDQVATALAAGEGITVVPTDAAMTTQQAADFLGVARPTLVRLLENGHIPFERPGRHRRVKLQDLLDYQSRFRADRRAALRDLARANVDAGVKDGDPAEVKRLSELSQE
jgi:excisionase family DNA binding protein